MQKALFAMLALVAISGTALAGGTFHLEANVNGESHTVDATLNDDGSAVVLVDGQPVQAPGVPEAPALPTLP